MNLNRQQNRQQHRKQPSTRDGKSESIERQHRCGCVRSGHQCHDAWIMRKKGNRTKHVYIGTHGVAHTLHPLSSWSWAVCFTTFLTNKTVINKTVLSLHPNRSLVGNDCGEDMGKKTTHQADGAGPFPTAQEGPATGAQRKRKTPNR